MKRCPCGKYASKPGEHDGPCAWKSSKKVHPSNKAGIPSALSFAQVGTTAVKTQTDRSTAWDLMRATVELKTETQTKVDYTKAPYMPNPVGPPKRKPSLARDSEQFAKFDALARKGAPYIKAGGPRAETLAEEYATRAHQDQTDQVGAAYIEHPRAVRALMMETPEYQALSEKDKETARIVAILHDTLEDTCVEPEDLKNWGFSQEQIDAIDALSKRVYPDGTKETAEAYYERLKQSGPVAVAVKLGDLGHNTLEPRRAQLEGAPGVPVPPGGENRYVKLARKYVDAIQRLGGTPPKHLSDAAALPM